MMPMKPIHSQEGSSLIELVVGGTIALIVLGAIISLQIRAYRYQHADASRYEVQLEAANGLERIVQDVRSASSVTSVDYDCNGELTLTVGTHDITYRRDEANQTVTRTEWGGTSRVIGHRVECLWFDKSSDTLTITWTGAPANGSTFELRSTVSPRVTTN